MPIALAAVDGDGTMLKINWPLGGSEVTSFRSLRQTSQRPCFLKKKLPSAPVKCYKSCYTSGTDRAEIPAPRQEYFG